MLDGDIFNLNGEKIGSDGLDDKKVYLMYTFSSNSYSKDFSEMLIDGTGSPGSIIKEVDITTDELNVRAFLATLRNAENHGNGLLGYDSLFGVGTFKGKDSNKDGKISNKEKFADHPREATTAWGTTSTAAGAYQFLESSWDKVAAKLSLSDFSGGNQDKGVLQLIRWQNSDNPRASGVISDINSGNIMRAFIKLNGTWTSLPGGKEQGITRTQAIQIFNSNRANELMGNSPLASPVGSLKL